MSQNEPTSSSSGINYAFAAGPSTSAAVELRESLPRAENPILASHKGAPPPYSALKMGQSSTLARRANPGNSGVVGNMLDAENSRGHCSELDLPSYDRLPVNARAGDQSLHRPDSVITTSSIVSSETGDSLPVNQPSSTASSLCPPIPSISAMPAQPDVYTISGLYGGDISHTPAIADRCNNDKDMSINGRTHKRSTSNATATSIIRGCQQMTHKRSHSHTVGYNHHPMHYPPHNHLHANVNNCHRRNGSSGFVVGHRRTASGALVDALDQMTGGALDLHHHTKASSEFLHHMEVERRASKADQVEATELEEDYAELRDCGYWACKPACARPLASIKVFVLLLSMLVTLQQALSSGYLNSVITTIEKRYEIPSSISGIIASMYEIGNVGTVIFVSYLGSRRHIPVWIGTGVIFMGVGSIIFVLPHFLSDPYSMSFNAGPNMTDENICKIDYGNQLTGESVLQRLQRGELPTLETDSVNGLSSPPLVPHNNHQFTREDNCIKEANKSSALPIFIFMIAQLLLGCGGSPLFTLGTTYIDDHVNRESASVYIGFMYSMVAFGPVLGFLLGAYLLGYYVDTGSSFVETIEIDSSSRHWIGMWWGGFFVIGVLMILISLPFFAFPKELKREKRKIYLDEKYNNTKDETTIKPSKSSTKAIEAEDAAAPEDYGKNLKDLPKCIWKLITNWIYMVTCFGACMELVIVSGFIVFLPKYLETQFALSKSEASMLTGGTAIPGACIGIFLGGYLLKRLQLRPRGAVQLVLLFNLLCLCCYGILFFLGCNNVKMAGATMPYNSDTNERFQVNLTASCNLGCSCDMNDVQPVCGANGLTYFSPCHAGCTSLLSHDNFTNCACVGGNSEGDNLNSGVTKVPVATAGPCYTPCEMIFPFIVLLFFMTLLVAITQMPVLMVVLRSVAEEEKAFALGIQFVIFRLFGYIPSPIVFGSVIDSTCLVWKQTCEGSQGGRCLMYDIELFRYKYVGICAGIKLLSFLIFLFDWYLIKKRQEKEEERGGLTMGEVVNSMVSIDKLFEAENSGSQNNLDKQIESEEGRVIVAGVANSSSESTPTHASNLTPSRQPMIPVSGSDYNKQK